MIARASIRSSSSLARKCLDLFSLCFASALLCQSASLPLVTFEVASIKPQAWTGQGNVGVFLRGGTLVAEHVVLNDLIEFAYNLKDAQLSGGPSWASRDVLSAAEMYQVTAKPPVTNPPASINDIRLMLQALLAERFQLQVHHATKLLPVFDLVAGKGKLRLKEGLTGTEPTLRVSGVGSTGIRLEAANVTIQRLIDSQLGLYAGRPVIDKTGLGGSYDFSLEWTQESLSAKPDAEFADAPTLAMALSRQLGLKLEPATAPFDIIVVDRAEKASPN